MAILEELPENRFQLRSKDQQRQDQVCYIVTAQSTEQYHEWVNAIKKILQGQHDLLKALTSPIEYQRMKES